MALFACKVGGSEGSQYGYTYPVTVSLSCGHNASAPQGNGASVTTPIIGALLKDTKTITASFKTYDSIAGSCLLLDSVGNTVATLINGDNDVSAYTEEKWNSIVAVKLQSGHYTAASQPVSVGSVIFKNV